MSDRKTIPIPANPELPGMPVTRRVCSAEFHLSILQTAGRSDYSDFCGMTLEEFVDFTADLGMEIWYGGLGPGTGPSSALLHSTHLDVAQMRAVPGQPQADFEARYVERSHRHGILVIGSYKMNAWPALAKLHPDWLIQDIDDGREVKPNEHFVCYNSPFGEWLGDYLAEQVERFDLDGVWFDDSQYGSKGAWPWPAGCVCPACNRIRSRISMRSCPSGLQTPMKPSSPAWPGTV